VPLKKNSKETAINKVQEFGILIPAYKPDLAKLKSLLLQIAEICQFYRYQLIIVDDGSDLPDDLGLSGNVPFQIIRHPKNFGKGAALRTGLHYFAENEKVEFVITMDADLQHTPQKIPDFILKYRSDSQKLILGYRIRKPGIMPFHRILSNTLTSLIISAFTGKFIRDSQCGYRLIDRALIDEFPVKENGFHFESEFLLKCAWRHVPIGFVSIPTVYQKEKSSIKNIRDTINFVVLILRLLKERALGWSLPPAEMR
jgi:glycosyltransferase involved in cell wall biosynthesis